MSISFVDCHVLAGSSSSYAVSRPDGLAAGDLMVLVVTQYYNSGVPTLSSVPSGFSLATSKTNGDAGAYSKTWLYTKVAETADETTSTYTVTKTDGIRLGVLLAAFRGAVLDVYSAGPASDGRTTSLVCPTLTPSEANSVLIMGGYAGAATISDGPDIANSNPSWTLDKDGTTDSSTVVATWFGYSGERSSTSATGDFTATVGSTQLWSAVAAVLVPAEVPPVEGAVTLAAVSVSGAGDIWVPGVETTDGDYTVVTYSAPGQGRFHAPTGWQSTWMTAEVLVVGGGGPGGNSTGAKGGGGGGAGGYLADAAVENIEDLDVVTVGAGGTAQNGGDSEFASLLAYGGGYGTNGVGDAGDGGSGGGLGATSSEDAAYPGTGVVGQGHDGASAYIVGGSEYGSGGSGGGATGAGTGGSLTTQPTVAPATNGGAGTANDITGTSLTYAVGGGGGQGGGSSTAGAAGTNGRGNGGAGGQGGGTGGKGGNGTVILRFLTPLNEGLITLAPVSVSGLADVSAAYTGTSTTTLGVVRATGSGYHPLVGDGRVELGPVQIPLGISADTIYLYSDVLIRVASAAASSLVSGMSANAVISVAGEEDLPWLRDDGQGLELSTDAVVRVVGAARLNTAGLPATDNLGYTAPSAAPPALHGLRVSIGGKQIKRALIGDLTIELSDRGGYDSATLVIDRSVRLGQYALLGELRVTYGGTVLFRGRLESRGPSLGDAMYNKLVFIGPIAQLKDHQGFRRIYVDTDLASWSTGQGPNTSANVFEVEAD